MTIGRSEYGTVSASIMDLCTQLRALGVSSEIKLPTLVTAGNQSSGKSSLVEGIAGIPLPRAAGTCTRCPTEVRMRRAPPAKGSWLCHVKLKREFDAKGCKLAEVPSEELFCTISKQQDITTSVAAAQAALLNPTSAAQIFLPSSSKHSASFHRLEDTGSELEFTSNSVVLEIQGSEVDLTIVDLPGIIQSHPKGQQYVDVIKGMVVKNIEEDHVIIVMTLTAMDDLENQAINLEARKVDPDGRRMIGVITKPDNIPEGEHGKWLDLARNQNQRQALALGYYVVKNPGQKQLDEGITFEAARQRESEFFAQHPQWCQAHAELGERMGTGRLRDALSEMLVRRIQQELPVMRHHADEKLKVGEVLAMGEDLAEISAKLRRLPPKPSSDSEYEFQHLLQRVAAQLSDQVHGAAAGDKLAYQKFSTCYRSFQAALLQGMPVFKVGGTTITVLEDAAAQAPEQGVWTLEAVKQLRAEHLGSELPSFSPYSAVVALISAFKGKWKEAIQSCLEAAKEQLHTLLTASLEATFGQFPELMLLSSTIMSVHLEEVAELCMERLLRLCGMEELDVFTLNDHYFTAAKDGYLGRLKMASLGTAWPTPVPGNAPAYTDATILASLVARGINFSSLEQVFLAQPTRDDNELHMMAATLAYFKVAYKRILDEVPLHIRDYFLRRYTHKDELTRIIYTKVKDELQRTGRDLQELLAEDAAIDNRRRQLLDLKGRLTEAIALLQQPTKRTKVGAE